MPESKADYLFECSWEVCNKVGGIYTVVKSKAALMVENYSNYFLVGPYFQDKALFEAKQVVPPDFLKEIFEELEKEGIICYFFKWRAKGEPQVILIDFKKTVNNKDAIKEMLWKEYKVESLFAGWDFEEPMLWSIAVAKVIEKIAQRLGDKKIVGHFHEWLAGFASLYLKSKNLPNVATVFTTHATMLGRSIAGSGQNLYSMLDSIDAYNEAKSHGILDKFTTERACAHNSDIFTTVSEITGIEAEKILGRKPEVLVLNGLDVDKFPTFEEVSIKHKENREIIRSFLKSFFLPYYYLNVENNLIFFIVGRYEYKNKGLDILIKALGRLNNIMKEENSHHTVTVLFWIPSGAHGVKTELLENEDNYRQLSDFIERNQEQILQNIEKNVLAGHKMTADDIVDDDFLNETKKLMAQFKKEGSPPLSTHVIFREEDDDIIKGFHENGLLNKEDDKVKVINYPVYLNGADNLIALKYYDAIVGCHLGIFPSYYEPWGYTPLESAAFGVPAITTDLGGFGRFLNMKLKDNKDTDANGSAKKGGIYVLDRYNKSEEETLNDFTEMLHNYTLLNKKQRVKQKMRAKELTVLADWSVLIENYIEAHNQALAKKGL